MIMTWSRHHPTHEIVELEHYVWVFFIHDALVVLALWQMYYDFQYKLKTEPIETPKSPLRDIETPKRKRVITEKDLGSFFN